MELTLLLTRQILIMFFYMALGFLLFKSKKITKEGSASMGNLLVWLVVPVLLIRSFCIQPTPTRIVELGLSFLATVLALGLAIVACRLLFPKHPIENFGCAFSNAAFIGLPLVTAIMGQDAVFYIVFYVALLNILQWIYGVPVLRAEKTPFQPKNLLHPLIFGTLIGLILFFTGWGAKLPKAVTDIINGVGALNSPLAMIILGVYLAQADLKSLLTEKRLYLVSLVRLLVVPLLTLGLMYLLKVLIPGYHYTILISIFLTAIAPVGSNVAVYAQLYQKDYVYASKTVVISTLFSLISMPILIYLAQLILA